LDPQFSRCSTKQVIRNLLQQLLSRRIYQPQLLRRIKSKNRNVHFLDDAVHQSRGFDCSCPALSKQISQGVDFQRKFAQSVAGNCQSRTK
jgi:hypothetical protein